jgi:hypothetical protein
MSGADGEEHPMNEPTKPPVEKVGPVTVDYDKLDVTALMEQVAAAAARTRAADARAESPRPAALQEAAAAGGGASPGRGEEPGPAGIKGAIKRIGLKLMRPFFPLIRFLGLPLHQDIRETQRSLSETDKRLDTLDRLLRLQEIAFDDKLALSAQRIDKTELRLDLLEARIKDLDESMEYIRLLHNLCHNLVVELTKLRIELDTLKSKAGILEKDLDYLRTRERALEGSIRP